MDKNKLEEGLAKLSGYDMEAVENECRKAGNTSTFLTTTSEFQSRLAARALGTTVQEIRSLPINEYNRTITEVLSFLYKSTGVEGVENQVD